MNQLTTKKHPIIINIHAGFDETSVLISNKFPDATLQVLDFYDPKKHTEISIKRARKAYPSYFRTIKTNTHSLPIQNNTVDLIFVIFSAHEMRTENERNIFFNELHRILKSDGNIILTEHLRDIPNFIAYNIGFMHFILKKSWHKNFEKANLIIYNEIKINPFITTFILKKHGITP